MKIDHIGYAVKKIGSAETFRMLGFSFGSEVEDESRNIRILFGEKDGYRIELVSPLDTGKKSPVDAYLHSVGPTPYHICYASEHLDDDIEKLKRSGFKEVIKPEKAVALGGRRVVFMTSLQCGLLEIVEAG